MDCQDCELVEENRKLREIIERQQEAMNAARGLCLHVYSQAGAVMGRKSGVPRGTWSLWKGRGETARQVYNLLSKGG